MLSEMMQTLAPDMEIKIMEKAKFDGKEWMAILIREKKEEKID